MRAKLDGGWGVKANFLRGVTEPALMAVTARLDEAEGRLTLDHPEAGRIVIRPTTGRHGGPSRLARAALARGPARAHGIYRAAAAHLTDVPDPWVSINNHATLRAVGQRAGRSCRCTAGAATSGSRGWRPGRSSTWWAGRSASARRPRGARAHHPLQGDHGEPRDRAARRGHAGCARTWDHQDFGVYAAVTGGGTIRPAIRWRSRVSLPFPVAEPDAAREAGRALFRVPAEFVKGVVAMSGLPPADRVEVCFAGRSNVGKSSLINALTARRNLARASNTPGRTQELNFFALSDSHYLVDLPGYGFANAPKAVVESWQALCAPISAGGRRCAAPSS
jgi:hypothetical protein